MKEDLIKEVAPFEMEYKVVHLSSNSPWQIDFKIKAEPVLHLGLCLPKSCSNEEIFNITRKSIEKGLIEDFNFLEFEPAVLRVKDLSLNKMFFTRTSLILFIVIVFATHLLYNSFRNESPNDFLSCFDLRSHLSSLFTLTENRESSIPVINGYKSVLCTSFVIAHVMYFSFFTMNNRGSFISSLESASFQVLAQTPVLVEGFFVISAFLSCHNFLRNKKQMDEIKKASLVECAVKYCKMVLNRYLR